MAEQTTTEFNFTRPDGSYGTKWSSVQEDVTRLAQECIDQLKNLGAHGQVVEILTRVKTVSYSEESHFNALSTD